MIYSFDKSRGHNEIIKPISKENRKQIKKQKDDEKRCGPPLRGGVKRVAPEQTPEDKQSQTSKRTLQRAVIGVLKFGDSLRGLKLDTKAYLLTHLLCLEY